jgi:hypothetical protein
MELKVWNGSIVDFEVRQSAGGKAKLTEVDAGNVDLPMVEIDGLGIIGDEGRPGNGQGEGA